MLTQKQREIILYRQLLKDNNVDFESPETEKNRQQEAIEEEEENFSRDFEPVEREVNSQRPFEGRKAGEAEKRKAEEQRRGETVETPSFKELGESEWREKVRDLENQLKKQRSNHDLQKKDLQGELLKNEEDLKLLLRRNGDLEETLEKMREKQKKLKEKLKNQVQVEVKESEADEELKKNLKNSLLQQNLEKMKNISTSLLKQKEEEYQKEMRKLKLTMDNLDNANLSKKNQVKLTRNC